MTQQPPAAPPLHPKRCETCDKGKLTRGVNFLNAGVLCNGVEVLPDGVATINVKGCCSHSSTPDADARQRIVDALTVAEDAIKTATLLCVSNVSREFTLKEVIPKLTKRIALLKDGVERK